MKYNIGKVASPAVQTFGKGAEWPKCACLQPSQMLKNVHEPPVPMLFPLFGAQVDGAEFLCSDFIGRVFCGIMANVVAQVRHLTDTSALPKRHKCATETAQVRY